LVVRMITVVGPASARRIPLTTAHMIMVVLLVVLARAQPEAAERMQLAQQNPRLSHSIS